MTKVYTVPKKLKVGFNEQKSTTNGLIAYVIYYDTQTGKLRKEKSFEQWRSNEIDTIDLDNTPMSGFIFSSSIIRGGHYRFDNKVERVRVYDPRGFDVEITLQNLMYIIEYYNINQTEILGKLAYVWYETELVLLPVTSEIYKDSLETTNKFSSKFSLRDLVVGRIYEVKVASNSSEVYLKAYIGSFKTNSVLSKSGFSEFATHSKSIGKKHIFVDVDSGEYSIVNPKNVVGIAGEKDNCFINDHITSFENSIYNREFEKNLYLLKIKGDSPHSKLNRLNNSYKGYESNALYLNINGKSILFRSVFDVSMGINGDIVYEFKKGFTEESNRPANVLKVMELYPDCGASDVISKADMFVLSAYKSDNGSFYDHEGCEKMDDIIESSTYLGDISGLIDYKDFNKKLNNLLYRGGAEREIYDFCSDKFILELSKTVNHIIKNVDEYFPEGSPELALALESHDKELSLGAFKKSFDTHTISVFWLR